MQDTTPFTNLEPAAAIVLAAGASTRMGSPKQMLPYEAGTLLSHCVAQATHSGLAPVIVVLGANMETIVPVLDRSEVDIVLNPRWEEGMGTSVQKGLMHLEQTRPEMGAVMILVADQPRVLGHHLLAMRRLLAVSDAPVVAAEYSGQFGVPALFRKTLFPKLLEISPAAGARSLLRHAGITVAGFTLPEAATDIDTPADFAALQPEAVRS